MQQDESARLARRPRRSIPPFLSPLVARVRHLVGLLPRWQLTPERRRGPPSSRQVVDPTDPDPGVVAGARTGASHRSRVARQRSRRSGSEKSRGGCRKPSPSRHRRSGSWSPRAGTFAARSPPPRPSHQALRSKSAKPGTGRRPGATFSPRRSSTPLHRMTGQDMVPRKARGNRGPRKSRRARFELVNSPSAPHNSPPDGGRYVSGIGPAGEVSARGSRRIVGDRSDRLPVPEFGLQPRIGDDSGSRASAPVVQVARDRSCSSDYSPPCGPPCGEPQDAVDPGGERAGAVRGKGLHGVLQPSWGRPELLPRADRRPRLPSLAVAGQAHRLRLGGLVRSREADGMRVMAILPPARAGNGPCRRLHRPKPVTRPPPRSSALPGEVLPGLLAAADGRRCDAPSAWSENGAFMVGSSPCSWL